MGAERSVRDEVPKGHDADGEWRIVILPGGMRWRATVVARLISEDIAAGRACARLILRLECLSARRRPVRLPLIGASSLGAVSDAELGALLGAALPRGMRARK